MQVVVVHEKFVEIHKKFVEIHKKFVDHRAPTARQRTAVMLVS